MQKAALNTYASVRHVSFVSLIGINVGRPSPLHSSDGGICVRLGRRPQHLLTFWDVKTGGEVRRIAARLGS